MFAPGWHRKWLLMLLGLVALYVCRYRLVGALVSKLATLYLAKKEPSLKIDVQVKLALLQPLQLVHVEITGGNGDWTLLFTRITVHSFVREFFRSFGQTKIWVLAIEDVVGELRHLDENLLRELLQRKKQQHSQAVTSNQRKRIFEMRVLQVPMLYHALTHVNACDELLVGFTTGNMETDEANPVGFLRFVDFQVAAIQLKLHCFEVSTEFRCRALSIGITDVLVKENLLHVKMQTSSVYFRSFRQSHGAQDDEGIIRDGVSFGCPTLCLVTDLRLVNRKLIGYKLIGVKDEQVSMQLCTSFFEFVMLKRLELMNRGLFPVPKPEQLTQKKQRMQHSQSTVLSKEITNARLNVIIVHELEDQRSIPLRFVADVASLSTSQVEIARIPIDFADESDSSPASTGVCHQGTVNNICATTSRGLKQDIFSVSTLELSMTQTHQDKGDAECAVGAIEMFASPRVALIFQSLAAWEKRSKDLAAESEALLSKESQSPPARGTPDLKHSGQVEWGMTVTLQSWKATAVLHPKHAPAEEMVVDGGNTRVTTKVSFPASKQAKQYDVQVERIRADVVTPFAKENQKHSAVFLGAEFTIAKDRKNESEVSVSSIDARFQSVLVNHPSEDIVVRAGQFPVASMKVVVITRQDRRAKDSVNTEMSVSVLDSHLQWNHQVHAEFLKEWSAILAIIDKVDLMFSPSKGASVSAEGSSPLSVMSKTLALDIRSKNAEVVLYDVRDITKHVTVRLKESRVIRQQQRLTTQTSCDCSLVSLLWGSSCPGIEVTGVTFHQKILLGPQRQLSKIPVQINIRASQMKVFMRPDLRLLQLLLRFDELVNVKKENEGAQPHQKTSSRQGIAFNCAQLSIEVHDKNLVDVGDREHEIFYTTMNSLEIKSVLSKSFEINESIASFLRAAQNEDTMDSTAHAQLIDQVLGIEGSITVDSLILSSADKAFADSRGLEIQFTITDVARNRVASASAAIVERLPFKTMIFDFSALTKCCEITVEKNLGARLSKILPVIRETFNTQGSAAENAEVESSGGDWRLRYIGNMDFGLQQCTILVPYGDSSSTIVDCSYVGLGKRVMRVSVKDFALNFRQFQKLSVQLSTLRVLLEELTDSSLKVDVEPPLQLVYLPHVTFDAMVYWEEGATDKALPIAMATASRSRQFALSFELSLKSKAVSGFTTQVPAQEEALIALNWDYVYPLLVYFLTEDEDDTAAVSSDQNEGEGHLRCIGIQWDASVDVVQIAFWDVMTNEVGLLLVTNDFLSHGLTKNSLGAEWQGSESTDGESSWVLHEATTYIDVLRVYILRNPVEAENYGEATIVESAVLPFNRTNSSNFFFETIGTSYRAIFSPDASREGESQDNGVEALFSEYTGTFHERMHDSFMPIDFNFSLFGSTKLWKASSLIPVSSTSYTVPPMLTPSSSTTSFLPASKSPRVWAQSVRVKLMKLKRRSSSMDNLLLNDGSCPIQIDSMKLLWTIETRDTVFYTTSLILDSMQRLAEANKYQQERLRSRSRPVPPGASEGPVKINTWRPPSSPSSDTRDQLRSNPPVRERRGSTRDTLLDLLHQGKLGAKQMPSQEDDGAQGVSEGSESRIPTGLGEGEEMNASRSIAFKKYTLDIHDAQINIREENSQSNVLVATKHIHLEVGLDELRSHSVAHLKFDSVTAHVAPIDVDISAGVLWYAYSVASPVHSPRGQSAGSSLLKQVMEECSVSMTYSQALATGATAVEVELSFLQLSTDRHQFYQLLNVMRHVLLAPPTVVRKPKRAQAPAIRIIVPDLLEHETSDMMIFPASPSTNCNPMPSKKTHAQVVEELRNREAKQLNSRTTVIPLKFISFRVEGTQFRLRSSPEITGADHEFVEIRGEGIAGCHTYFSNQCTKLILNLQWMEINNLRPGPSSIAFEDAMAVLKAKLLVDKRYQSSSKVNLANQKGMLTIRAESGPLIRVLGQKLRVLDVLEVSMFPEISNIIVIQLASDFYELVYKFFFEQIASLDHHDLNSEQVLFGRKAVGVHAGQMSPSVRSGRAATTGTPISPSTPTHPRRKSIQLSASMSGLNLDSNASFASSSITASASSTQSFAASESGSLEDDDSSTDGCELFYFKYVRIGNVRLRINCNGFFVNLSDFDLDLPPFVCQSKLCTWKKLLQKFESHLKWYVTKESASSGLSHFKNKFLKWTPSASSSDKKDKNKKEEDSSMINAQVLFGPYSGATN